jgi:glycosyltransferase domain-containing protein
MNLSDITLVILSYHRQHCLRATLNFYRETNLNILVLDNSPEPLNGQYIPANCKYILSRADFAARSIQASMLIDTKYTIIGADDEIYLPSALFEMKVFLDNHEDYVAVGGNALAVWGYGNYVAGSWAYKRTFGYHNNESSPYNRIRKHTGNGVAPLTSFFTCNLTRSKFARTCLRTYGQAPVLATDAISVLTICGGGKSKYLKTLYWIRNWNQSPRSHKGWDRSVYLHDWWKDPTNHDARTKFEITLNQIYSEFGDSDSFKESWALILKSSEALESGASNFSILTRRFSENTLVVKFKFLLKSVFFPAKLPSSSREELNSMKVAGIEFDEAEALKATELVSKQIPYKDW